jgi:Flp pilus assembly protein TadD
VKYAPHVAILAAMLVTSGCARDSGSGILPFRLHLPTVGAPAKQSPAPDQASLYLDVVGGLVAQRNYGAALAFLDDYRLKQADLSSRYWLLRGDALLGSGRRAEALAAYGCLDASPLAPQGWNGKGRVAAASQQWREAESDFRKAVLMQPSNADFLNNLAFAYLHEGDSLSSVATLRQAHELDPASNLIRNNLIVALTMAGDRGGAEQVLDQISNPSERNSVRTFAGKTVASNDFNHDGQSP